jgi:nitrous oxidase accessory protein
LKFSLFLVSFAIPIIAICDTISVCDTCEVKSIKTAISLAESGDQLIIQSGKYVESSIFIDKKLHIKGIDYPIIDGSNLRDEEVFVIQADSVIIEGIQVQNVGPSYVKDLAAIRVQRKKHFEIKNNKIIGSMFAIYLEYADSGMVKNNEIIGNEVNVLSSGNGIHAWYCSDLQIIDNSVDSQRDGIYFEFVKNSTISNNSCTNNLRYGLHFMFSNFDNYNNNIFRNNGAGVAVMFSNNISMKNNRFVDNWGGSSYGLLLKEIYDAEIENNEFNRNSIGIRVEGSTRINYQHNTFLSNGWAIKIAGGCYDNNISSNNFISNSFDLSLESAVNNNILDGNYWSNYSGYDLNKDGIGDVPHRPVELFNYIVTKTPEATVLLRSLFLDIINLSEKVTPIFTPANVFDNSPKMKSIAF